MLIAVLFAHYSYYYDGDHAMPAATAGVSSFFRMPLLHPRSRDMYGARIVLYAMMKFLEWPRCEDYCVLNKTTIMATTPPTLFPVPKHYLLAKKSFFVVAVK